MRAEKPIKVFSLSRVNYCPLDDIDVVMYIHDKNTIYTNLHTHDFYELTLVSSGKLTDNINGEKLTMQKNDFCLLAPETIHQQIPDSEDIIIFSFGINVRFIKKLTTCLNLELNKTILKKPIIFSSLSQKEFINITQLLSNIGIENIANPLLYGTPNFDSVLKVIVTEILLKIFRIETNMPTEKHHPLVSAFLKELSSPDNFNLSLIELCTKLNLSQGHISHLFKKANLNPPCKIYLKNKLTHAAFLLQNSEMRILDIMETCGIYSTSYFNKVFKNEFGVSPSDFRNKTSARKIQNVYYVQKAKQN